MALFSFSLRYPPVSTGIYCRVNKEAEMKCGTHLQSLTNNHRLWRPKRNARWDAGNRWILFFVCTVDYPFYFDCLVRVHLYLLPTGCVRCLLSCWSSLPVLWRCVCVGSSLQGSTWRLRCSPTVQSGVSRPHRLWSSCCTERSLLQSWCAKCLIHACLPSSAYNGGNICKFHFTKYIYEFTTWLLYPFVFFPYISPG